MIKNGQLLSRLKLFGGALTLYNQSRTLGKKLQHVQIQLKYGMHRNTRDLDAVEELSCTSEAAMDNIYIYIIIYIYIPI